MYILQTRLQEPQSFIYGNFFPVVGQVSLLKTSTHWQFCHRADDPGSLVASVRINVLEGVLHQRAFGPYAEPGINTTLPTSARANRWHGLRARERVR